MKAGLPIVVVVSRWLVMIVVVTVMTSTLGAPIVSLLSQIQLILKLQGREKEREREV